MTGDVTVIGAGVVGVCCARYLQRDGVRVTLVDRGEPGAEASASNAGILSSGGCVPIGTPGVLRRVPRMLRDPLAPLALRPAYLPRAVPWLVRFVRASAPGRVEAISIALKVLLDRALDSYRPLLEGSAAAPLVRTNGLLYLYGSEASFAAGQASLALRRRRGVDFTVLTSDELRDVEPALAPVAHRAVLFTKSGAIVAPGAFVRQLADDFARDGGTVRREAVTDVGMRADGRIALQTPDGARVVDRVVVAAGAWSKPLAARLGARVPLDTERGYFVDLPAARVPLTRPFISADYDFAIAPMGEGLRLAGTVELAGLAAPPNVERAHRLVACARRLFPQLGAGDAQVGMSFRPSMPDSLPVIGPSPRSPRVVLAFGHGHLGMTFGAITGRLVTDLVAGRTPAVDVTPYRADRF